MLEVIVPADDLNLLTIEELRTAVGLAIDDPSQDEKLEPLGLRVAAMIAATCNVPSDGVSPPTLPNEDLKETLRITSSTATITLSRRPIGAITSLVSAGSALTRDVDYEVDSASGQLLRLYNDQPSCWACGKLVIEYDAGFETVPDGLKAIAAQLAGGYWADDGVDPMEKSLDIPDVIATTRWVDAGADPQMPADILNALIQGGYVNRALVL
jgi:hypothetical protein